MPSNEYHFITHWQVEGAINEVADILKAADEWPRWWPAVYLSVKVLEPGDKDGIGKVVSLHTKGWLPYTLRWQFRVTESRYPHGFSLEAWGDFNGRGIWTLEQDGPNVNVTYDWKIRADKPLLSAVILVQAHILRESQMGYGARRRESEDRTGPPPSSGCRRRFGVQALACVSILRLNFELAV